MKRCMDPFIQKRPRNIVIFETFSPCFMTLYLMERVHMGLRVYDDEYAILEGSPHPSVADIFSECIKNL